MLMIAAHEAYNRTPIKGTVEKFQQRFAFRYIGM